MVAAHPDDEVLGCGGTICRHVDAGDEVMVMILADGESSRDMLGRGKSDVAGRVSAAEAAAAIMGIKMLRVANLPDNRLDGKDLLDVVQLVESGLDYWKPQTVYTHHGGDLNIDHRIVNQAVITACRPLPCAPVERLLFFEIPSSTEWQAPGSFAPFQPCWFTDIGSVLERKLEALSAYASEVRPWPHPRSYEAIRHLAHWRGSIAGLAAAEAFMLGRRIVRE